LRSLSGAEDEDLFPHGAPIISDGLVFVEARRVSQQLLTSAYVIALDLNDGRVRWSQYITSSGGLRQSPRPFCTLVWNDGSLYTSSPVGAIARLDPANGEIMWLRRYNVPLAQPIMDHARRPWELTAPVITPRGVLAIQPDQRRVVLLDRETGEQVESFSATSTDSWNTPRYLLADDHHVFAIGTEVRAFDPEALDHPIWRLPAPVVQQTAPAEPPATMEPLELRGRDFSFDPRTLKIRAETGGGQHGEE
jgi:outer membrane protein assembly factor BamB